MSSTEEAFQQLETQGWFVWSGFLNPTELKSLLDDFQRLHEAGLFKRAGIGKGDHHHLNSGVRKDETLWLDFDNPTPAQAQLWKKLIGLKHQLNETFFLGLWDFEGHYAVYPPGGHYEAHVDRFRNDDARTISMVLYLNEEWQSDDGGELRIHLKGSNPIDIQPIGGRLVCFFSDQILHEVRPAKRERKSLAGWWRIRS